MIPRRTRTYNSSWLSFGGGDRSDRERVGGQVVESADEEAEEEMLSRCPGKVCRDGDQENGRVENADVGAVLEAVAEGRDEPANDERKDIDGSEPDEVIPV